MNSYKIQQEFKRLLKMGLNEDMAMIVAHAQFGEVDEVFDRIHILRQEQEELQKCIQNMVPFHENKPFDLDEFEDEKLVKIKKEPINIDDQQDKKPDLQHQL